MKVLSIDIDYCFPNVDQWPNEDNELWDEWHSETKWKTYFAKYPDLNTRENIIDEECLDYLLDTFTKALYASPNATVSFGFDHDYILNHLMDEDDIELVNIDHHDDFLSGCYLDKNEGEESNSDDTEHFLALHLLEYHYAKCFGKVDEGSWGAYLHSLDKLKSFTWIRNNDGKEEVDTRSPVNSFICEYIGKKCDWNCCYANEYDHGDYVYDHIFVCLSPMYFPISQWDLFSVFMGIYENHTGKDCKLDEFWDKRWINKMAYKAPYEILKRGLENVKKSLN